MIPNKLIFRINVIVENVILYMFYGCTNCSLTLYLNYENTVLIIRASWRWVRVMVVNATFNNISAISWRSVLLMEETRIHEENHRPVASHWQMLSCNIVSSISRHEGFEFTTLVVIGTDYTGSCKTIYHMITTTTTDPLPKLKNHI